MRKISIFLVAILFCISSSAQITSTLDRLETVYKDKNVTFRKLDDNTWIGSGNVMSSETMYLLSGKDRAVLIDAGTTIPGLDDIVTGIAGKPVTLVLTHVHPDHAGAAECFDEVWIGPGDTVNVSAFMKGYSGKIRYLKDGQKLRLGGRVLEAYFTPGHTPGSVTFLEKGTDRGFCGDAFGTGKGGAKGGILVFTDMETIIKTCQDSYGYMNRHGYKRLYCGHFYGENFMTPERIKCIESTAAGILKDELKTTPFEGAYGLNMKASRDSFTVRYVNRSERKAGEAEATAVIDRFTGGKMKVAVHLNLPKDAGEHDVYRYSVKEDELTIWASDGVAACRAFYDYVKSKGAGISSWSGNRFEMPADLSTEPRSFTSPYRDHQYMNVVTYGYTAPYWDEERWDRELDWMALHGIDMPLLLIAQEQVYREVFMDMGLTREEIDAWEVGPAHLPWMRMGNLSGNSFDGPLGEAWNETQVALCKHVIERMRRLGMKPICPAFGGFVPEAFVNHYDGELDYTGWDWVSKDKRNYRLNPGSKAFSEIGTRFIRKWEEKFGKCTYYLSDSFNEMEIPQDKGLMTSYGDAIYKSIRDANPDAVWTMQGWTVGFQRRFWGNGIFEALIKNVPDDRFMLLDMATDYNKTWWKSSYNWDEYPAFYGKEWVWSTIPNMGGKTAYTGVLDHYANGRLDAQLSPNRGNLTGYGVAAEGVENNEIIYELICDAGWADATESIDLDAWLVNYARCRYGDYTAQDSIYYDGLRKSVYNGFRDHPQFAWQVRNNIIGRGSVQLNEDFYKAVEEIFSDEESLENRKARMGQGAGLYQADLIEAAAMYTSGKLEQISSNIRRANDAGDKELANAILKEAEAIFLALDRVLMLHPMYNLELWEKKAMDIATNATDMKRNAVNARRIVSVWFGDHQKDEPVNDYACRIWAGLIRDYYMPRFVGTWNRIINGEEFDQIAFENSFVEKAPALTPQTEPADAEVISLLKKLVDDAGKYAGTAADDGGDIQMQNWRDMFFKEGL